jgi:hypothetical protein
MIKEKDYITALIYFENEFQKHSTNLNINYFRKIILCLKCLQYLDKLKQNDYTSGYQILNTLDSTFWSKDITISLYDSEDRITDFNLEVFFYLNPRVFLYCYAMMI